MTPNVQSFSKAQLIERYGDACAHCGATNWTLDHRIPVAAGGAHSLENCQPLCMPCNGRKAGTTDRIVIDVYRGIPIPPEGWKRCSNCRQTKMFHEFYTAGPGRGTRAECRPCTLAYKAEWYRRKQSA